MITKTEYEELLKFHKENRDLGIDEAKQEIQLLVFMHIFLFSVGNDVNGKCYRR